MSGHPPAKVEILHPEGWARPRGYANGVSARGHLVFVSGQVGWNARQEFETDELAGQVRQALENVVAVLAAGGAKPEHVARMTWFVTDKREYLAQLERIGREYVQVMGRHYPAMTLVQAVLLEDHARVEIEATAVVPST